MPHKSLLKTLVSNSSVLSGVYTWVRDLPNLWPNTNYRLSQRQAKALPVPSHRLILKVAGTSSIEWFLRSGALAAQNIQDLLAKNGANLQDFNAILDFGCGVGRVIRHWQDLKNVDIYGTDIDPDLVHWCMVNLPFAKFQVNSLNGKLGYEDHTFDLIYALSVFTHLTEELQANWMYEIHRALKPGGYVILTTHGDTYLPRLSPVDQVRYREGKMIIQGAKRKGSNFCNAYHPYSYVCDTLARDFTCLEFQAKGAAGNPSQDIYLFQKPVPLNERHKDNSG